MITFNYVCINDNCEVSGNIWIKKEREDEERPEFCHECDQEMKHLGEKANMVIRGDAHTRMIKNQAHFKQRAHKHAKTEEQRELKRKRTEQEFGSMGLVKKNKL